MDSQKNFWTIYMYTFPNGKRYIGATTRPLTHRQGTNWERYKRCKLLYAAIQEYGYDCIEQTILFAGEIENSMAADMERYFIEYYKTNVAKYSNPSYGYNQTDGGEGTTKKNISAERIARLKQQMAEFHRAKIGTHPTDESRRRMSQSHMGQKRGLMAYEQRMKISDTNSLREKVKPRKDTHGRRIAIIMYDPATERAFRFASALEAGYFFGVNGSSVTRWIDGSRTPPYGLLFFRESEMNTENNWNIRTIDIDRDTLKEVIA